MKIKALKKGLVIRLSNEEFNVLKETVEEGMGSELWMGEKWQRGHMTPAQQRIITEVLENKRDWMVITEATNR